MWVPEYHMLRGRAKGSALFIANRLCAAFFPDLDGPSLPGESHLGLGPQSAGHRPGAWGRWRWWDAGFPAVSAVLAAPVL